MRVIDEILANIYGRRNAQPFYNGWLIWRSGRCEFCSLEQVQQHLGIKK